MKKTGKQENLKYAHAEVQDQFAKFLAVVLENQNGAELQCCVTYSKPCGCIRKYVLGGEKWKEDASLQLKNADDFDAAAVITRDKSIVSNPHVERAKELLGVYEHAAELKKEKCYAFDHVEGTNGTSHPQRGMIGLGNGRKRSKKYEEYVLQMRSKLRNQYALCEKAAQKLLGYSINFLYKKLRTNPQKTSRLVATNKAERASKAPRHLIPLEELREMGRKPSGTNQCCGRNCISRLAAQHFDKIEDWRRRLEGSGQRVAQEIVAEVLRASTSSLDGQSNFCQNLVHWVTGCSFKKIRRVRDHLKKDPSSLPEHGLKKYWKDKVKNKPKHEQHQKVPKTERKEFPNGDAMPGDASSFYGMYQPNPMQLQPAEMEMQYNPMMDPHYRLIGKMPQPSKLTHLPANDAGNGVQAPWPGTNNNNSNNMLQLGRAYGGENEIKPAHMQQMPPTYLHPMAVSQDVKSHPRPIANNPQPFQYHAVPDNNAAIASHYGQPQNQMPRSYQDSGASQGAAGNSHQYMNQQQNNYSQPPASRGSVILHTDCSQVPGNPSEHMQYPMNANVSARQHEVFNQAMPHNVTGHNDMISMSLNSQVAQQYYIATPTNFHDNEFLQGNMSSGLTPFILSSGDPSMLDNGRNGDHYKQPFYILSPVPTDGGFTANDMKNFQSIPLTPVQILHTPCLPQGKGQEQGNGKQDQFLFPLSLASAESFHGGEYAKMNTVETTSASGANTMHLASVPKSIGMVNYGGWIAPSKTTESDAGVQYTAAVSAGKMSGADMYQGPPNITLEQPRNAPVPVGAGLKDRHQPGQASAVDANRMQLYQQSPASCMGGKLIDDNQSNLQSDVSDVDKGPDQDAEKDGIVTPKIIRDALSRSTGVKKVPESGGASHPGYNVASVMKTGKDEIMVVDDDDEEQCAPINSRLKRFSRDRLRATIDSPNIVLTPFTPLTPSVMPLVVVPDSGEENPDETGSDASGQHKDGSVFQFPPTHVSRRRAAIRLQGPTISENGVCKTKDPKDSPKTPGPFPVCDSNTSEKAGDKSEGGDKDAGKSSKSPALMLRGIEHPIDNDKQTTGIRPVENADQSELPSPIDITDDDKLNTPNQPINTPNSLNTPTQLHTPNQELKTPTDSPLKVPSLKRKRDPSPVDAGASDDPGQSKSAGSAKNLRFHCFTPRDFTEGGVNCSAFRKPTEFASTPTESSILQRRRRPRKQPRPSSVTNPGEGDQGSDVECQELSDTPDDDKLRLPTGAGVTRRHTPALSYPILSRMQDGNFIVLSNPALDGQSPALQMATPSFLSIASNAVESSEAQAPSQQLNTPILLQPAFVTPTGSGLFRKISPGSSHAGSANRQQVFTFHPGSIVTPNFQDRRTGDDDKGGASEDSKGLKAGKPPGKSKPGQDNESGYFVSSQRESGLETPSHLKVVTPSLVSGNSAVASESLQIFNFPNAATTTNVPASSSTEDNVAGGAAETSAASVGSKTSSSSSVKPMGPVVFLPTEMIPSVLRPNSGESKQSGGDAKEAGDGDSEDEETGDSSSAPAHSKHALNPVGVTPGTVDGGNIQTPTMVNLVSPSLQTPNSPLVLYQVNKNHFLSGAKNQSPLSANTATPPLLILQRGSSSSLLKSALMKSMPVFQFPPLSSSGAPNDTATSSATRSLSAATASDEAASSSASAVSVIRGPGQSVSTPSTGN